MAKKEKPDYIGTAKLRVGTLRDGEYVSPGTRVECTQKQLDSGYFDADTLEKAKKEPKPKKAESKKIEVKNNKKLEAKDNK